MLSVFDIFKVGLGPSSSHTNGPMLACYTFLNENNFLISKIESIKITLYGSLSLTGKGHYTDLACIYGLLGYAPYNVVPNKIKPLFKEVNEKFKLLLNKEKYIKFNPNTDIIFSNKTLDYHQNSMKIDLLDKNQINLKSGIYYSTGGGFIVNEDEIKESSNTLKESIQNPLYNFSTGADLEKQSVENNISIEELVFQNELSSLSKKDIEEKINLIWNVMNSSIETGLHTTGVLNKKLGVVRRAPEMYTQLQNISLSKDPLTLMDWINTFAMAVSEENASLGKIVTSPTNGSAGVIPAVLKYYDKFIKKLTIKELKTFF
ncbi:MAG: serine dehydratase beta chain [Psittacicella sp.]